MMNLNALKIDPEFQGKIPPLNFEEEQQLEQNILHEGRLLNPIIIWNGFILDGHTRYRILRKHPFIAFQIQEIKLDNRYAALSWICQNQLGRRNLDPERKKFLMGKLYESEKLARGGSKERAHDENGRFTSIAQNDPSATSCLHGRMCTTPPTTMNAAPFCSSSLRRFASEKTMRSRLR